MTTTRARLLIVVTALVAALATGCGAQSFLPAPAPAPSPPGGAGATTSGTAIPEAARQNVQIVEQGFSTFQAAFSDGYKVTSGVVLRNPNPSSWTADVRLRYTFRDATGAVAATDDLSYVYDLAPGATTANAGTDTSGIPTRPVSMQVEIVQVRWAEASLSAPGDLVTGPATVRPAPDNGGPNPRALLGCEVRSTYPSKISNVTLEFVYRDPTGKIIGGYSGNSDSDGDTFVANPNTSTPLELVAYFIPPGGVPGRAVLPELRLPLSHVPAATPRATSAPEPRPGRAPVPFAPPERGPW